MARALDLTGWRELQRAPVRLHGIDAGAFGDALELEVAGLVVRWRRGMDFLWDEDQRAILILQGSANSRRRKVEATGADADAYRKFMGRRAKHERTDRIRVEQAQWRKAPGYAARFDYWSDKFRAKLREYTHPFDSNVSVYLLGGARPPWVWALRGGRLRVTARGIEG